MQNNFLAKAVKHAPPFYLAGLSRLGAAVKNHNGLIYQAMELITTKFQPYVKIN